MGRVDVRPAVASAVCGIVVLLQAAAVAYADPTLVLTKSSAGPGEPVPFSISGGETRASYTLDVAGRELVEGSVPAETGVSGTFTMPDLGATARSVTVEAEIIGSDETATQTRLLRFVPASSTMAGQSGPAPVPTPTPAPALQRAPAAAAAAPQPAHRDTERARKRRRVRRAPKRSHTPRAATPSQSAPITWARTRRRSDSGRSPGAFVHASPAHSKAKPVARKTHRRPPRRRESESLPSFLTGPPTPAIFSLASGVAGDSGNGAPIALLVFTILGLTALAIASGGLPLEWRPVRRRRRRPAAAPIRRAAPRPVEAPRVDPREAAALFAPIPLAFLDEQAMLATRAERKYVLDAVTFRRLVEGLAPGYLILEIDDERVFPYDSVYFDTPTHTSYRQHVQDRRRRFKCRTRLYVASTLCFFEVKLKGGRGETIKRRLAVGVEEHGWLTTPALAFLERQLRDTYGAALPTGLAPALRTSYRRLTLVGRESSERLTFDFEVMLSGNGRQYPIQPGRILLETKSDVGAGARNGGAARANSVLRALGVRPVQSCTKYCLGMALTHPELSSNPFRPLLREHFTGTQPAGLRAGELWTPPQPVVESDGGLEPRPGTGPAWQEG